MVLNLPMEPLAPLASPTRVPGRPDLEGPLGRVGEVAWRMKGAWRMEAED